MNHSHKYILCCLLLALSALSMGLALPTPLTMSNAATLLSRLPAPKVQMQVRKSVVGAKNIMSDFTDVHFHVKGRMQIANVRNINNVTCEIRTDKIAFSGNTSDNPGIYVMNADGTNLVRLSNTPNDRQPTWSPDSTKIAFASTANGVFQIFVMNVDGSSRTVLTSDVNGFVEPAWSPIITCPITSEVSDQQAGSVLVYNLYSSSTAALNAQNTRISLTNTHPALTVAVHLFFVDGATCSIADSLVCLTANQTASFLASDIDPGTTGYIIAVASDTLTGCPINFNYLIGDAYVKLSSGHAANLAAEGFAALAGGSPACDATAVTALLNFDGMSYNCAPRVLAASNIPSRGDGNDTLIVLNRLGGSLVTGAATLSNLFGLLYDDAETPLSFNFSPGACQSHFLRVAS